MTLTEMKQVKTGDKIKTACRGSEVIGTVSKVDQYGFLVVHKPIQWGNEIITETFVQESTNLQKMFYSDTTPYAEFI